MFGVGSSQKLLVQRKKNHMIWCGVVTVGWSSVTAGRCPGVLCSLPGLGLGGEGAPAPAVAEDLHRKWDPLFQSAPRVMWCYTWELAFDPMLICKWLWEPLPAKILAQVSRQ